MQKIALVLAIAAVGEGLVALHLVRQLHEERENAQALQARVTELEQRAPQRTNSTVPVPAVPFTVAATTSARPPAAGGTINKPSVTVDNDGQIFYDRIAEGLERQRALLRDPEYHEAMLQQQKMIAMEANPDFARDLGLTTEQADRLYTTLAEQYLRAMETMEPPADGTDPALEQESQRKFGEQLRANLAEIKAVLGDAKFHEFEEYQAMAGVRGEAVQMRQTLASAGVPLDDALAKPLAKALYEHQLKVARARATTVTTADGQVVMAQAGFITDPDSIDDVRAQQAMLESREQYQRQQREALARVLSPQQLKVIEQAHEAQLQMDRVKLRFLQAQQAAGNN